MKRKWIALCSAIVLLSAQLVCVNAAKEIPDQTDYYVNDYMDVLSQNTEDVLVEKNSQLDNGAEIVVVTTDYINTDTEQFAYQLFNQWGIGDKNENNGVLIVLVINEEKFWITTGPGLYDVLDAGTLSDIIYDYLEEDFDAKNYDEAVLNTFNAIYEIVAKKYGTIPGAVYEDNSYQGGSSMGDIIFPIIMFALMLFVIIIIVSTPGPRVRRRGFRPRFRHYEPRRYEDPHRGGFGRPAGPVMGPRPVRRPTNMGPRPSASRPTRSSSFSRGSGGRSGGMRSSGGGGTRGGGAGRK